MASSFRSILLVLRSLQVVVSLAVCIFLGLMLGLVSSAVDRYRETRRGTAQELQETDAVVGGVMAVLCLLMAFCILSFILSLTWLVYTASPRARARAHCIGNHVLCARYTCDMSWDIVLVLYWAVLVAIWAAVLWFMNGVASGQIVTAGISSSSIGCSSSSAPFLGSSCSGSSGGSEGWGVGETLSQPVQRMPSTTGSSMAQVFAVPIALLALSCFMFVSYIVTAALCSAVRNEMRAAAHPTHGLQGNSGDSDEEGSSHVVHMHTTHHAGMDDAGRDVVGRCVDVYKWQQVVPPTKPIKG